MRNFLSGPLVIGDMQYPCLTPMCCSFGTSGHSSPWLCGLSRSPSLSLVDKVIWKLSTEIYCAYTPHEGDSLLDRFLSYWSLLRVCNIEKLTSAEKDGVILFFLHLQSFASVSFVHNQPSLSCTFLDRVINRPMIARCAQPYTPHPSVSHNWSFSSAITMTD